MSLWSAIFVSIPEEILLVITAVIVSGYKDRIDLTNRVNLLKVFIVAVLLVIDFDIARSFITSMVIYFFVTTTSCIIIYYIAFRYSLKATLLGMFNSLIILALCDCIVSIFFGAIFNIQGEQIHNNDLILIAVAIPRFIMQILVIFGILKLKKIDLIANRYMIKQGLYIVMLFFVLLGILLLEGSIFDNFNIAKYEGFFYIVFIIFGFYAIAVLLVYSYLSEEKKKRLMTEKKRESEMERIKQLIHEGKTEQILDLIEYNKK